MRFSATVADSDPTRCKKRGSFLRLVLIAILATLDLGATTLPISITESLEWMTRTSELIVIGRPVGVSPDLIRTNDSRFEEDATIKVERVLAGELSEANLTFRWQPDRRVYMKYWLVQENEQPNVKFDFHMFFFLNRAPHADGNSPLWTMRADLLCSGEWKTGMGNRAETTDAIVAAIQGELAYMRAHRIAPLKLKRVKLRPHKKTRNALVVCSPEGISPGQDITEGICDCPSLSTVSATSS